MAAAHLNSFRVFKIDDAVRQPSGLPTSPSGPWSQILGLTLRL